MFERIHYLCFFLRYNNVVIAHCQYINVIIIVGKKYDVRYIHEDVAPRLPCGNTVPSTGHLARAGYKIPPSPSARARATVIAVADFSPPGGGHRAIRGRRSKEFAFALRTRSTTHRRHDVNETDYRHRHIRRDFYPRVVGGAFPVRCAECCVLLLFRATRVSRSSVVRRAASVLV